MAKQTRPLMDDPEYAIDTPARFRKMLHDALDLVAEEYPVSLEDAEIQTYEEREILTTDEGLVVRIGEHEFYVTVQMQPAR